MTVYKFAGDQGGGEDEFMDLTEMAELAVVFQESLQHVLSNLVGQTKDNVTLFCGDVILREKPYLIVTEQGLAHMNTKVFASEDIRDFVLTLAFTFFARAAIGPSKYARLSASLATGASCVDGTEVLNAVPPEIHQRLATYRDTRDLIYSNKWLTVVLLLQLFVVSEIKP